MSGSLIPEKDFEGRYDQVEENLLRAASSDHISIRGPAKIHLETLKQMAKSRMYVQTTEDHGEPTERSVLVKSVWSVFGTQTFEKLEASAAYYSSLAVEMRGVA